MNPNYVKQLERRLDHKDDAIMLLINLCGERKKHERYQQSRIRALRELLRLGWKP